VPWAMDKHELIENSIFEEIQLKGSDASGATEAPFIELAELAQGKSAIVYAGTLEAYQGIDILLGALADLARKRNDFILVIAGGSKAQVSDYQQMAVDLGVAQLVVFLGLLQPHQARHLAKAADIILSPRSSGTNTPLKTYEQLACGVPLVATAIYSHTQVLNESMAVLVPPTTQGLSSGIEQLLDDPILGKRLVQNAQAHYGLHYNRDAYTKKLRRLLELVN